MQNWRRIFVSMGLVALMAMLACGDDEAPVIGGNGEAEENHGDNNDDQMETPPDDPEKLCEMACERVYANTSDGGCQQVFNEDSGAAMGQSTCEERCVEEDKFRGGAWCVITEAECGSHPDEMIDACLPDGYHVPHCEHLPAWDQDVEAMEERVVELVNELREEGVTCPATGSEMPPVGSVSMDEHLRCAARLHSMDMEEQNYFAHDSLDGRSFADRIVDAEYPGEPAGENIAMGSHTAEGVVDQWLGSDTGHCENMLESTHNEMGIGMYKTYWTQKFGR